VKVTEATIIITCTKGPFSILWGERRFELYVGSDEFRILGIAGRAFNFRLAPYDEEEWRFPFLASENLPQVSSHNDSENSQIEFTFAVTASGDTKDSTPFLVNGHTREPLFGYRHQADESWSTGFLEDIILSAAAQEALRNIRTRSSPSTELEKIGLSALSVSPELEQLAQAMPSFPDAMRKWLMHTWEEAGSFNDESIEKLARTLVKLRSPYLEPDILVTLAQAASRH